MPPPVSYQLFAGLTDAERDLALELAAPLALAANQELFPLGAEADHIYLVESGRIVLRLPLRVHGKLQDTFVEEKLPGDTVGWSAFVPPYRFTLQAVAAVESRVLSLSRDDLLSFMQRHPATGNTLLRNVVVMVGTRLQTFQAMWAREIQRLVDQRAR